MTTQNYLMIENGVVTNILLWDGNTQTWQPPSDATMLVQETTPTKVWGVVNEEWVLVDAIGNAEIGFTWDGSVATTNQPKPNITASKDTQPLSQGTQTL